MWLCVSLGVFVAFIVACVGVCGILENGGYGDLSRVYDAIETALMTWGLVILLASCNLLNELLNER